MKASSLKFWRKRTHDRTAKHGAARRYDVTRFKCKLQTIKHNKLSKR